MNILKTPKEFLDFSVPNYPSLNSNKNFESYFYDYFLDNSFDSQLTYIPVQWTNLLINRNYGKEIDDLKDFLNTNIEKNKKYFTIVQYAGGPIVELENTIIFSMGGVFNTNINKNSEVIPLPLVYDHKFENLGEKKKYIASYVGRNTHKSRLKIEQMISKKDKFFIKNLDTMNSNIEKENIVLFEKMIQESYFSLCPRGFGPTSFRLYESIKMGTVPVYISDDFFLPYKQLLDWSKFSILLNNKNIKKLPKILNKHIDEGTYENLKYSLDQVKDTFFSFEYMTKYIQSVIETK